MTYRTTITCACGARRERATGRTADDRPARTLRDARSLLMGGILFPSRRAARDELTREHDCAPRAVIVSRHAGAADWVRARIPADARVEVVAHLDDDVIEASCRRRDIVIGVLPIEIVARLHAAGCRVVTIAMPSLRSDQRGRELTPAEMDAAGARLMRVDARVTDWV